MDITSGRIYTSRHVQFIEHEFPFKMPISPTHIIDEPTAAALSPPTSLPSITVLPQPSSQMSPSSILHQPESSSPTETPLTPSPPPTNDTAAPSLPPQVLPPNPNLSSLSNISGPSTSSSTNPLNSPEAQTFPSTTENNSSPNQASPSTPTIDTSTNPLPNPISNPPQNQHQMQTRSKNNITKPNTKFSLTLSLNTHLDHEPTTVSQAVKDKKWRGAMSEEYDAHAVMNTWELVPPQPTQNIVGCK